MRNYQLSPKQYLVKKYSYMLGRINEKKRSVGGRHYYKLPICSLQEFLHLGLNDTKFKSLFSTYKRSKGTLSKAPSVDRINNSRGYTTKNIQFLTLSDNVKKAFKEKKIVIQDTKTLKIFRFRTTTEAANFLGHKWRIKKSRKSFRHLKTNKVFLNLSKN